MPRFRFCPELFDIRNDTLAVLSEAGYEWMSHFGSVDIDHSLYGIEVCGIHEEEHADAIMEIMERRHPDWPYSRLRFRERWTREPGWAVIIHRDPEDDGGATEWV